MPTLGPSRVKWSVVGAGHCAVCERPHRNLLFLIPVTTEAPQDRADNLPWVVRAPGDPAWGSGPEGAFLGLSCGSGQAGGE